MKKLKILCLCIFSNKFSIDCDVTNYDISIGKEIFYCNDSEGKDYDLILAAPPCTQFTKANNKNWQEFPEKEINIVLKCLLICIKSKKPWILENPPGRIEKLIPELKQFRQITLSDKETNKEWVLYSNLPLTRPNNNRYGKKSINNFGKIKRNEYPEYFYEYIESQIKLFNLKPGLTPALNSGEEPGLNQTLKAALSLELNSGL